MLWIHAINEVAATEFNEAVMNPMSSDKFRTLGRRLRLEPDQHILDIGAGRCGPALIFAKEFGCRITAVEPYEGFVDDARRRFEDAGLTEKVTFVTATAEAFLIEPDAYDACMCIGATWAWGGLHGTLDALSAGVRGGGHVVAGEPFIQKEEQLADAGLHNLRIPQILTAFEERGLNVVSIIRSSEDDWDMYQSIKALSLADWLESNPGHDERATVEEWRAKAVDQIAEEAPFGWALIAGRAPL